MKVFYCTNHDSHYPVGAASVVVAQNQKAAKKLLDDLLTSDGLKPSSKEPYDLTELDLTKPEAFLLVNGDY